MLAQCGHPWEEQPAWVKFGTICKVENLFTSSRPQKELIENKVIIKSLNKTITSYRHEIIPRNEEIPKEYGPGEEAWLLAAYWSSQDEKEGEGDEERSRWD